MIHPRKVAMLTAICCIGFTADSNQAAIAVEAGRCWSQYMCSCERQYRQSCCYGDDCQFAIDDTIGDGDYYYQQKYVSIYAPRPAGPAAEAAGGDACPDDICLEAACVFPCEDAAQTAAQTQDDCRENNEEDRATQTCDYQYALSEDVYGASVMPRLDILYVGDVMATDASWEEISRYLDEKFTGLPYVATDWQRCETQECESEAGRALCNWDPAELLTAPDRQALRALQLASDRSPGVRRAIVCDHIESLSAEAAELCVRLRQAGGPSVPELADDLPQTAALIACIRLVERGELRADEAADLWLKSLTCRSDQWNRWIDEELTAEDNGDGRRIASAQMPVADDSRESRQDSPRPDLSQTVKPMLRAVVLTAAGSLERMGGALCGISRQLRDLY